MTSSPFGSACLFYLPKVLSHVSVRVVLMAKRTRTLKIDKYVWILHLYPPFLRKSRYTFFLNFWIFSFLKLSDFLNLSFLTQFCFFIFHFWKLHVFHFWNSASPVALRHSSARRLGCSGMSWPHVHPPLSLRYHFLIFEMFEFLKSCKKAQQKTQRFQKFKHFNNEKIKNCDWGESKWGGGVGWRGGGGCFTLGQLNMPSRTVSKMKNHRIFKTQTFKKSKIQKIKHSKSTPISKMKHQKINYISKMKNSKIQKVV